MPIAPSRLAALTREGWTRQFTANEPRLSEAVALYEGMGYQVHLEPIAAQSTDAFPIAGRCTLCFAGAEDRYKIIFTRKIS